MGSIPTVVVTGASGFIAKHVIAQLLELGYGVRGTLRSQDKILQVRQSIADMVSEEEFSRFSLFTCDLLSDAGWAEAMLGADAVMHMATVVSVKEPKDRNEIIGPAVKGTERVLRFTKNAGISRFVMTSSIAAIGYGHSAGEKEIFLSEKNWTNVEGLKGSWAYAEGKTRSESLAWDAAKIDGLEVSTVCPSMVLGPAADSDTGASLELVRMLLAGKVPMMPPGGMSVVDVRDVAQIHVTALATASTIGRRIIASADFIEFLDIAKILGENYPGIKVPTRTAPAWLLRFLGRFDSSLRQIAADFETIRRYDGSYGERLLGREYRTPEEATISAAESLYELGVVAPKSLD